MQTSLATSRLRVSSGPQDCLISFLFLILVKPGAMAGILIRVVLPPGWAIGRQKVLAIKPLFCQQLGHSLAGHLWLVMIGSILMGLG